MDKDLYKALIDQFAMYTQQELEEVLNDDESSEEALAAAKYILSGESKEAKDYKTKTEKYNSLLNERENKMVSDPTYDDIHQIAGDIRFLRNTVIIWSVLYVIITLISACLR